MTPRMIPLTVILALMLSGAAAMAQDDAEEPIDDCPEGLACVAYGDDIVFELDPDDGKTQAVIVGELVRVAVFLDAGNGYVLAGETVEPREGVYEDAEFGDLYVLSEREQ